MLVIVSDLHLTDGTSGTTIDANAFRIFRYRLRDLAYAASWRKGGKYEPIEELHVVLLGDIFDLIRSTEWLRDSLRPWDDLQGPGFSEKIKTITRGILTHNPHSLDALQKMALHGDITVPRTPPSLERSHATPIALKGDPSIRVKIHYQVGNHDWFFHLPGDEYNRIRQDVINAMGLANDPNAPFAHSPEESQSLRKVYEEHGVWARHGDIFDPMNFEGNRNKSSIGDGIVIDLLTRFPLEVKKQLDAKLSPDVLADIMAGLKELDNVRPLIRIPDWIDGLLRRTCKHEEEQKLVKAVWDGIVEDFLENPSVRTKLGWLKMFCFKSVLEFSASLPVDALCWCMNLIGGAVGEGDKTFYENAITESAFKQKTAKFIVYGHTHHNEVVPLDLSFKGGSCFEQLYLNTGTWRRVFEMALGKPNEQEFVGYNVMTYAAFYKADERDGRSFEKWDGALGV